MSGSLTRTFNFFLILAGLLFAQSAHAALSFTLTTGRSLTATQDMTFDSNQCPTQGPVSAWTGGVITNTGGSTVTGISATLSGLTSGFALVYGSTATQSLGALAAGESISVFWHVNFSCVDNAVTTPSLGITSSLGSQSSLLTLRAKKAISANAGGNVASATLGPGAVVGQLVYFDTNYSFGSSSTGDEIMLMPAGNTSFNSQCFRLSRTQITSSNINGVPSGSVNQLYFAATTSNGNGSSVSVRFSYQYLCANTSTTARPYAQLTSGTQLKYTGNYDGAGSIAVAYPGATNPFTISKTSSVTQFLAGNAQVVTYTVTINNPSTNATYLGAISDTLPAGATYGGIASGSDVTAANSSSVPASGATGTIQFTGKLNQSYLLPAGGSVILKYTATIPGTVGNYSNSAYGIFGTATTTPTATATIAVSNPLPLAVVKSSATLLDAISTANPKNVPGAYVQYTINVTNPNFVALTNNSVVITDPTAASLAFIASNFGGPGSGPVLFAEGSPVSNLQYQFVSLADQTDDVDFSNNNGVTWTYVPQPDVAGIDAQVKAIRIRPRGTMAAGSKFEVKFRYKIE